MSATAAPAPTEPDDDREPTEEEVAALLAARVTQRHHPAAPDIGVPAGYRVRGLSGPPPVGMTYQDFFDPTRRPRTSAG